MEFLWCYLLGMPTSWLTCEIPHYMETGPQFGRGARFSFLQNTSLKLPYNTGLDNNNNNNNNMILLLLLIIIVIMIDQTNI